MGTYPWYDPALIGDAPEVTSKMTVVLKRRRIDS